MRDAKGRYVAGVVSENSQPVGTLRMRTRHKRGGQQRYFRKIAHPKKWVENARFVWEESNGVIPRGYGIHHIDGNSLNDELTNLSLVSKAEHLEIHRPEFADKALSGFIAARKRLRWSTKSKTKSNRRGDIAWTDMDLRDALSSMRSGCMGIMEASRKYGISDATLRKYRDISR